MPEYVNPNPTKYDLERDAQGTPTGGLVCKKCKEPIMSQRVAHPIWDGPFPCSGSGKCHYENVPYCPKCESVPSFHGTPLSEDPVERSEREKMRRIIDF